MQKEDILKTPFRDSRESFVDPDFAEALNSGDSSRQSSHRQAERKTRQFCRQVQRAINLALAGQNTEGASSGIFADEVLPAPDCGRLLVYVLVPAGRSVDDVLRELARLAPQLRAEVASAISRKRAPELCFAPVPVEEGGEV